MSTQLLILIGVALTAVGGVLGAIIQAVLPKKGSAENQLIDQLQEQLAAVERRERIVRQRERILDDYANQLREHINDRQPPPPPMWPSALTGVGTEEDG